MVWCNDELLPRLDYRFLPVDSLNLAERGVLLPKSFCFSLCPSFKHVWRRGDGVAHAHAREAIINIMLIMRKRNRLKTIG